MVVQQQEVFFVRKGRRVQQGDAYGLKLYPIREDSVTEQPVDAGGKTSGGNDDVETTLSLTCNIVACLESECSNLISECSRRKRRSAVPQNQQYTTTITKVFRK